MPDEGKCPKCGAALDERALFCSYCGERIVRTSGTIRFDYRALLRKLEEIDAEPVAMITVAKGATVNDPLHQSRQDAKKALLVSTCPLPKGADELLEFAHICASNASVKPAGGIQMGADTGGIQLQDAWKQKGLSAVGALGVVGIQDPVLAKQAELLEKQLRSIRKPLPGSMKTLMLLGALIVLCLAFMLAIARP